MQLIPSDLVLAADDARGKLTADAASVARANIAGNRGAVERTLADAADRAIFSDAVLGAMRSHLDELRTVSK